MQGSRSFLIENVQNSTRWALLFVYLADGDLQGLLHKEHVSSVNVQGTLNKVWSLLLQASENFKVALMDVVKFEVIIQRILDAASGNVPQQDHWKSVESRILMMTCHWKTEVNRILM